MNWTNVFLTVLCLSTTCSAVAQITTKPTQTIRGTIVDQESRSPLLGASISILTDGEVKGATTDLDGQFRMQEVPVGRYDISVSYLGYEPYVARSVIVGSGKEVVLNLQLEESTVDLSAVEVSARSAADKTKTLNPFAVVSSRTFSVEETARYAAASFDPARMAKNYAGVNVGGSDDLFNEIVIRGNAPSGILWRLEGIEIPNPNHFGSFGNGGGAISMLSSTTLSNSDFYTGAFPAEFGNAISGVFDLNMRNGNNEKRESSFMFGALGIELATEGPFRKGDKSSYLINYRYSTLAVIQAIGINPTGDVLPTYQDLSFKFNFPTKKSGTFALFGLGGDNLAATNPAKDSTEWMSNSDREGWDQKMKVGVVGLSHRLLLSDNSYLRTVIAGTIQSETFDEYKLDRRTYAEKHDYRENVEETNIRLSTMYHHKLSARTSLRLGGILTKKSFSFFSEELVRETNAFQRLFNNYTNSGFVQGYAQIKHKLNDQVTMHGGLHYSLLTFNQASAIEPRAAITVALNDRQKLSFSSGLHSRMENLALYTFSGKFLDGHEVKPKEHLGLTKSWHNVIGYDHVISPNLRIKLEAYHQALYNVPIRKDPSSKFSILNTIDIWDIYGLDEATPDGTGTNIGLDLTLERFFSDRYYFMVTGSVYDSRYKTHEDKAYNTRYNGNYQINMLGGKEMKVGRKGHKTLGLNGRFVVSGGSKYTEIDLAASIAQDDAVFKDENPFSESASTYYRIDLGFSYRMDRNKTTHTIMLDMQNVTNRLNAIGLFYDDDSQSLEEETMNGLFPFFNYRIEF